MGTTLRRYVHYLKGLKHRLTYGRSIPSRYVRPRLIAKRGNHRRVQDGLRVHKAGHFVNVLEVLPPNVCVQFEQRVIFPVGAFGMQPCLLSRFVKGANQIDARMYGRSCVSIAQCFSPFVGRLNGDRHLFKTRVGAISHVLLRHKDHMQQFYLALLFHFYS